ncbi:MAG: hypothetical protein V4819_06835 [Verrucomicrobiota bacterium]
MRSSCHLLFAGCLLSPLASAQEAGSVTIDLLTLKMPAELAAQLQKRIEDGGPGAATAVDRLPDLAKDKKLTELDRWHAVAVNGVVSKRTISRGADLKWDNGEIVPVATTIEIEPTLSRGGTIDLRMAIGSDERVEGISSRYLSWQIATPLAGRTNEWIALGSRRDGEQAVLFLGKFSGTEDPSSDGPVIQTSLSYSLCRLEANAPTGRLSGEPARELLKKAKILEAGSLGMRDNSQATAHGQVLALDEKPNPDLASFSLEVNFCFAADRKTAETKVIAQYNPPRAAGKSGFEFADWVELPVGTVTLLPVNAHEKLFLALDPKLKAISTARDKPSTGLTWISPSSRRLLATAAGLPVPKPEINKPGFELLPKIPDSLAKLGLELPPGVQLIARGNSILMFGKNAPHERLKEILAKHLPPAAGPPAE